MAILLLVVPEWFTGHTLDDSVNAVAPFYIFLICGLVALQIIRRQVETILSPAFFFPFQSAVFLGVGPLVEVWGNDATKAFLNSSPLAVSAESFTKANTLSCIGILLVFAGFWAHGKIYAKKWNSPGLVARTLPSVHISPRLLALGFTIAGFCFLYFIKLPAEWGMIDLVVPGVLTALAGLVHFGFGLVAYLATSGDKFLTRFFWTLWPIHFFLTILTFAKAILVAAILLPILGAYMADRKLSKLVMGLIAAGLVYSLSQDFVHYGRNVVSSEIGNISQADYSRRVEILSDYLSGETEKTSLINDRQGWWTRLNYINVQAFAIDARDSGESLDTFQNAWIRFIPRFFWPDKPIITGAGIDFNYLISGRDTSSLGLTIYGDAYWQFGWLGVILIMPLFGFMLAAMSLWSVYIITWRQFIYFPLVLLGIQISIFGPVSFILDGIISVIPLYLAYFLAVKLFVLTMYSKPKTFPSR